MGGLPGRDDGRVARGRNTRLLVRCRPVCLTGRPLALPGLYRMTPTRTRHAGGAATRELRYCPSAWAGARSSGISKIVLLGTFVRAVTADGEQQSWWAGRRMTELVNGAYESDTHQKALRINLDPRWYG